MTYESGTWFHPAFVLFALGLAIAGLCWWRVGFRRAAQVFSIDLFVTLFWLASYTGRPGWPVDLFLFSDPLVALVHTMASRTLVPLLLVSLVFLALAVLMGRVFCSHVCPLGVLFDLSDPWLGSKPGARTNRENYRRLRRVKYSVLLVLLGSAAAGFNLLGLADPLVIFTRFAAVIFVPATLAAEDLGLDLLRPLAGWLDWTGLAYEEIYLPSFEGAMGMIALGALLLLLSRMQPRFWCRHLCPLGALLAVAGHRAPYRRRVGQTCNGCDDCTRKCPTGAIHPSGGATDPHECIACQTCVRVCPEDAVRFAFKGRDSTPDPAGPLLSRRGFAVGLAGGVAVGLGLRIDSDHPALGEQPPWVRPARLIRPPGALPEPEFLARCLRCGECMRSCLTNTLQPDWYRAGVEGLWAPHMNLRHTCCEHSCNVCGQVCPTEAIRPLSLVEKQHAKVGTAVIRRQTCIAWAEDRRCQICDEICPYNAIYVHREPGHKVGLPVVDPTRCTGCGACEEKCPVKGEADIVVVPHSEFRLAQGSYVAEAGARGFNFKARGNLTDLVFVEPGAGAVKEPAAKKADLPPLPPGISPEE